MSANPYPADAWAIGALAAGSFLVIAWYVWAERRNRPRKPAPLSKARPEGTPSHASPCYVTGCPYPGRVTVSLARSDRWQVVTVCHGCADEGEAHGWFIREPRGFAHRAS